MRLRAIPRIAVGLVSLAMLLLLAFDLVLHVFPDRAETERALRVRQVEQLAIQAAALVQAEDRRSVVRTLQAVRARDPQVESIVLRRDDGAVLAAAGQVAPGAEPLSVGIAESGRHWGTVEVSYRQPGPRGWLAGFMDGPARMLLLFVPLGTLLFYLYLKRVLQHLDPSTVVPDRVRNAFDTLSEGVLIVDAEGRVMLANRSASRLQPPADEAPLTGRALQQLGWLQPVAGGGGADPAPWLTAVQRAQPLRGMPFQITDGAQLRARVNLNCSPLLDEGGALRGCIVTLDDVTALEQSHEQLLEVLADLAASKQELEVSNRALQRLATRDPLTGCLNRRAFFEQAEKMREQAQRRGRPLAAIMVDIDHFKSINDRFGHAVGDQAIKRIAELLQSAVRDDALVGRYGGEEFCVVAPGMDAGSAAELAESIRARLADNRGEGLGPGEAVVLRASLGVSSTEFGATSVPGLVDEADRALYAAKEGGRNRVVVYDAVSIQEISA